MYDPIFCSHQCERSESMMKRDNLNLLIRYLLNQNNWISSNELTNILQISSRSLRNYVSEINNGNQEKVILSSKLGYLLNKNNLSILNEDMHLSRESPDFPSSRTLYWIRKLLMSPSIEEIEIIEKLFLSDATVKRDLKKVSKVIKLFNLSLVRSRDKLSIRGTEFDKRRLSMFCSLMILDDTLFDFEVLALSFKDYPFLDIRAIIEDEINQESSLSINGYVFNAIFLYVGIAIIRLSNGHSIQNEILEFDQEEFATEYHVAGAINSKLENLLKIELKESETLGLAVVLTSYLSSNAEKEFDEELVSILTRYNINITNTKKTSYLMDYISRMNVRSQYGIQMIIPKFTLEYIKIQYQNSYFLSNQILKDVVQNKNLIYFEEDVIELSILLNDFYQSPKLQCLLVVPQFYDVGDCLKKELITFFSKDLEFVFNQRLDLSVSSENFDLIITTFPIYNKKNAVMISPIFSVQDKLKIIKKILEIKNAE